MWNLVYLGLVFAGLAAWCLLIKFCARRPKVAWSLAKEEGWPKEGLKGFEIEDPEPVHPNGDHDHG